MSMSSDEGVGSPAQTSPLRRFVLMTQPSSGPNIIHTSVWGQANQPLSHPMTRKSAEEFAQKLIRQSAGNISNVVLLEAVAKVKVAYQTETEDFS